MGSILEYVYRVGSFAVGQAASHGDLTDATNYQVGSFATGQATL